MWRKNTASSCCGVSQAVLSNVVSDALKLELGEVEVYHNQIPVDWMNKEQFKGRVAGVAGNLGALEPLVGAFEVWQEGGLLYSKLAAKMWPNCKAVAANIKAYNEALRSNSPDAARYLLDYSQLLRKKSGRTHTLPPL